MNDEHDGVKPWARLNLEERVPIAVAVRMGLEIEYWSNALRGWTTCAPNPDRHFYGWTYYRIKRP